MISGDRGEGEIDDYNNKSVACTSVGGMEGYL